MSKPTSITLYAPINKRMVEWLVKGALTEVDDKNFVVSTWYDKFGMTEFNASNGDFSAMWDFIGDLSLVNEIEIETRPGDEYETSYCILTVFH